jgi:hypothetical protein
MINLYYFSPQNSSWTHCIFGVRVPSASARGTSAKKYGADGILLRKNSSWTHCIFGVRVPSASARGTSAKKYGADGISLRKILLGLTVFLGFESRRLQREGRVQKNTEPTGLEPATFRVTGGRSNQLNYGSIGKSGAQILACC